ncbi:MFS transporter [Aestuariimicrobium ganziense]|uniref:MFS transporter n=1 Tax=Aestuariimicrobium ganziense TaxID=2773677 RepID=UPI0019411C91|nr:MFS transporter [Aestuariimicrobium ganziense]
MQAQTTALEPESSHRFDVTSSNFTKFWIGQGLSQFGMQFSAIALPVLAVTLLHATEAQVGYLNASMTAAFLLVGLPAGAWIDRWFKRRTMIIADAVRVVTAASVPVLWFLDVLEMWQLYLLAGIAGIATVFFDVAYQSFIPFLVHKPDIPGANSRLEATSQVARLGGPALGGLLLKVMSAPVLLIADALGYLASMVFLMMTRDHEAYDRQQAAAVERRPLLAEIGEGLAFVVRHPAIRLITASTLISNLTSTLYFTLSPILVLRIIGLDGFTYGVIMGAGAIGGLLGATLTPALRRTMRDSTLIAVSMLVASAGAFGFPLATLAPTRTGATALLVAADALMAFGVIVYNITQVSIRQALCPQRLLGRMNASIRFMVWGVMPISSLASGWLGSALGVVPTTWWAVSLGLLAVVPLLGLRTTLPPDLLTRHEAQAAADGSTIGPHASDLDADTDAADAASGPKAE